MTPNTRQAHIAHLVDLAEEATAIAASAQALAADFNDPMFGPTTRAHLDRLTRQATAAMDQIAIVCARAAVKLAQAKAGR